MAVRACARWLPCTNYYFGQLTVFKEKVNVEAIKKLTKKFVEDWNKYDKGWGWGEAGPPSKLKDIKEMTSPEMYARYKVNPNHVSILSSGEASVMDNAFIALKKEQEGFLGTGRSLGEWAVLIIFVVTVCMFIYTTYSILPVQNYQNETRKLQTRCSRKN